MSTTQGEAPVTVRETTSFVPASAGGKVCCNDRIGCCGIRRQR
ncbi:hypothetical protein [Streptomyces sp. NPDC091215]